MNANVPFASSPRNDRATWRHRMCLLLGASLLALGGFAVAQSKPVESAQSLDLKTSPITDIGEVDERLLKSFEIMRRVSRIDLVAADIYELAGPEDPAASLTLELFPGESATFDFNRTEVSAGGSRSWNGYLRDESSEGYLTLTANPRSVSGVVEIGFDRYVLRSITSSEALVGQVDDKRDARCLMPHTEQGEQASKAHMAKYHRQGLAPLASVTKTASNVIDLIVFYTPEVADNYVDDSPIVDVDSLAADMNTSFVDSGVDAEVRVIHYQEIDVDNPDTGAEFSSTWEDMRDNVGNLSNTSTYRTNSGGDLVVLLVEPTSPDLCGIAGSIAEETTPLDGGDLFSQSTAAAAKAFAVISVTCAAADLTFNHELGHNLGGWHDYIDTGNYCGINTYSCGFTRASSPYFRTIESIGNMSGGNNCTISGCPRKNRWSNYNKTIVVSGSSYALGRPFNGASTNDFVEDTIDSTTASFVAGYRSAGGSASGSTPSLNVANCMTTVNAGWGAASNAPGWYETQTASNSGFTSPNPLYTVSSRAISYTLSSNHYFRVRACNILGCGSWNVSSLINVSQCI